MNGFSREGTLTELPVGHGSGGVSKSLSLHERDGVTLYKKRQLSRVRSAAMTLEVMLSNYLALGLECSLASLFVLSDDCVQFLGELFS